MTQEYLAEKADLGFNYIYRLENKQLNVKLETIEKIIQALEVDMNTFLILKTKIKAENFHNSLKILETYQQKKENLL